MHKRVKNRDILLQIVDAIGNLPHGLIYEHTVSGNPATFKTNVAKAIEMTIPFTPVQDLNGQEYPWPPGGGTNICSQQGNNRVIASVKSGVTYTFSVSNTGNMGVNLKKNNNSGATIASISTTNNARPSLTFTPDEDCDLFLNMFWHTAGTWSNYQLEVGSTATPFTPYENICPITGFTGCNIIVSPTLDEQDGTTYAVSWSSEAGTVYGGTLTVNKDGTGTLVVDSAYVDLGDLNYTYSSAYGVFTYENAGSKIISTGEMPKWKCSGYKVVSARSMGEQGWKNTEDYTIGTRASYSWIVVKDTRFNDANSFKTAVSGVQLVYELATPVTYNLTAEQIKTLLGTNNIWTNTNGTNTIKYMKRG